MPRKSWYRTYRTIEKKIGFADNLFDHKLFALIASQYFISIQIKTFHHINLLKSDLLATREES